MKNQEILEQFLKNITKKYIQLDIEWFDNNIIDFTLDLLLKNCLTTTDFIATHEWKNIKMLISNQDKKNIELSLQLLEGQVSKQSREFFEKIVFSQDFELFIEAIKDVKIRLYDEKRKAILRNQLQETRKQMSLFPNNKQTIKKLTEKEIVLSRELSLIKNDEETYNIIGEPHDIEDLITFFNQILKIGFE